MRPKGNCRSSLRELWNSGTLTYALHHTYSSSCPHLEKGFKSLIRPSPYSQSLELILHLRCIANSMKPKPGNQEEEPTQDEEAELETREVRIIPPAAENYESCADILADHSYLLCSSISSGTYLRGTFEMRVNEPRSGL